jgi:hypothetical protein
VRTTHFALVAVVLACLPTPSLRAQDGCAGVTDGVLCTDDGDPCTTDLCAAETCRHDAVPNRITCDPVVDAYRRTLGLRVQAVESTMLAGALPIPDAERVVVTDGLATIETTLIRASDALAGRLPIPPLASGETLAQARARATFGIVRDTPGVAKAALVATRRPAVKALGPLAADLARRMRFLYRSLAKLKRELRRLQRVSGVLAR